MTYLSDKQLAEHFGISRTTVWRWSKSNSSFPKPVNLGPGATRWRVSDIEKWELSCVDESGR
jgi:predicted DNA-binding transcriptional regulator AlpA